MTSVNYFVPNAEANLSPRTIAAYLDAYTTAGSMVVDPFCQCPTLVVEALAAKRRVVAVSFNPLDALRTRLALTAPPVHDLNTAITRLSDSPKLGVPLREHLQRLYRTTCPQCGKTVIAEYFIWERDHEVPKRVSYHCTACGDSGIRDCNEHDTHILQEVQPHGLHYWYVLDRVAGHEERARKLAASLLQLYTARNLYVLSNLVLKIENLFAGSLVHDFLRLALLHCLELGSKLNAAPGEPTPSHILRIHPPSRFVEWNVWRVFEKAVQQLTQHPSASTMPLASSIKEVFTHPVSTETEKSTSSVKAFVGHMSVRQLVSELPSGSVSLILTQPPQLGRTYWALPYLWTGWLYGHEKSALLWPLIRRRSSDWPWYLRAMRATLFALQKAMKANGRIVFLSQGKGLAYHETMALAAAGANLYLESALYHPREQESATKPFSGLRGDYRLTWIQSPSKPPCPISVDKLTTKVRQVAVAAAEEVLQERGEPAPFVRLHCHVWEAFAQRGILQCVMSTSELAPPLEYLRQQVRTALEGEVGLKFVQLWESEDEECLWWLVQPPGVFPLTERVEQTLYEILKSVETIETADLMQKVYARFPGMLTPDAEWVLACLKSYGQQVTSTHWSLKEEEHPEHRIETRKLILHTLVDLGRRWGYEVKLDQNFDVQWIQAQKISLAFVVLDSAALSRLLNLPLTDEFSQARKFVIIPKARQSLLRLKLARSMTLRKQLVTHGWQFIADVDLRQWATQAEATLADLDSLLSLDLLAVQDRTQLSLI